MYPYRFCADSAGTRFFNDTCLRISHGLVRGGVNFCIYTLTGVRSPDLGRNQKMMFVSCSPSYALCQKRVSHALVEGGTHFLVPGGRLEFSARALRTAGSSVPGPRLGAGLGVWLTWTLT